MTESAVVYTDLQNAAGGEHLARQIKDQIPNGVPDAIVIFASPSNNYSQLLHALRDNCPSEALIGCSTAGEFTNEVSGQGMSTAIALRSSEMRFKSVLGRGIAENPTAAAEEIAGGFTRDGGQHFEHKAAMILIDALAGFAEVVVERLTTETAGAYRFFGGGAGDDGRFQNTHVFYGTEVYSNAAVALEILSNKPLGISARHGWTPASPPLRVTEVDASQVVSLNVAPAAEAFAEHAETTHQVFDRSNPMPFFLHNIVGVKTPTGHKLRVPLGVTDQGAVVCAAEIPSGATTHIMSTAGNSAAQAAGSAAKDAMAQVTSRGDVPKVALFFDCVATRLRLGSEFQQELKSVSEQLGGTAFAGFNSYGQIVRADGQFSGFHNCTAVVCVIPE